MQENKLMPVATIVSTIISTRNINIDVSGDVIFTGNDGKNTIELSLLVKYVEDCLE